MPKQKSSAQIHIADGAGGMRQVTDLRFETGEWPIKLVVLAKDAETWMAHLRWKNAAGIQVRFPSLMLPRTAGLSPYIRPTGRHQRH